jgi:uncharacterized protein YsxB (DUF464 family)
MITVKFCFKAGKILGFKIDGHARFAKKGHDIVCAAVSAVAQTAILGLDEFLSGDDFFVSIKEGNLEWFLQDKPGISNSRDAQIILKTLYLGIEAIEREYAAYVKLIREV